MVGMEKSVIPYEEDEQIAFVQWMQLHNIPHAHVPNEIGGSSRSVKIRAIKMKRMGTSKGFPDLLVFLPFKGITGAVDAYEMVAIEMKRKKGGTVSKEQKQWIEILTKAGVPSKVCRGADEAIDFVKSLMQS